MQKHSHLYEKSLRTQIIQNNHKVITINSTINTGITRDESPFLIILRENESIIKTLV